MVVANRAHAPIPKLYQYPERPELTPRNRPERRPRTSRSAIRRVCAGVLVVVLALVVVYRYGKISQINMEINRDTNTLNALKDEQRHLEIAIAELTALERLEKIALEEMGMQYPNPDQIQYVGNINPESGDGDGE